jgi:hypothetical protein
MRGWLPAAPVRLAIGLAVATIYVGVVDPARRGVFPPCPFRALTGWWCPGCGMTRATHHLLHGDVIGALRYNALLPFVLALITVAWLDWYSRSAGRRGVLPRHIPAWVTGTAIAITIAFGVVRNLPGIEFLRG